ncbi:Uncharacterised protein [Vibrio cholerae]|nr:Uncharacterised protein [Vibrio cholerae]
MNINFIKQGKRRLVKTILMRADHTIRFVHHDVTRTMQRNFTALPLNARRLFEFECTTFLHHIIDGHFTTFEKLSGLFARCT